MIFPPITSHPGFAASLFVPPSAACLRAYNGSIARLGRALWLAERVEDCAGRSGIRLVSLTSSLHRSARAPWALLPPAADGTDFEDPRLFVLGDELWLSYVELCHAPRGDGIFRQRLARIDPAARTLTPRPLQSQTSHQKNWTLFSRARHLAWLSRPAFAWPHGEPSGGTPALPDAAGRLIAFGHSHLPEARRSRRYSVFAFALDPTGRTVTHVSRQPLWSGSEADPAIVSARAPHWMPLCVFPAGLVREPSGWLVSLGVNDSFTALVRWADADLDLIPVADLPVVPAARTASGPTPSAAVRVCVAFGPPDTHGHPTLRWVGESGGPFHSGQEFFTTPERAVELGPLVRLIPSP